MDLMCSRGRHGLNMPQLTSEMLDMMDHMYYGNSEKYHSPYNDHNETGYMKEWCNYLDSQRARTLYEGMSKEDVDRLFPKMFQGFCEVLKESQCMAENEKNNLYHHSWNKHHHYVSQPLQLTQHQQSDYVLRNKTFWRNRQPLLPYQQKVTLYPRNNENSSWTDLSQYCDLERSHISSQQQHFKISQFSHDNSQRGQRIWNQPEHIQNGVLEHESVDFEKSKIIQKPLKLATKTEADYKSSIYLAPCYDSDSDTEYVDGHSILAQHKKKYLNTLEPGDQQPETSTGCHSDNHFNGPSDNVSNDSEDGYHVSRNNSKLPSYMGGTSSFGSEDCSMGNRRPHKPDTHLLENFMDGISEQVHPIDYSKITGVDKTEVADKEMDKEMIDLTDEPSYDNQNGNDRSSCHREIQGLKDYMYCLDSDKQGKDKDDHSDKNSNHHHGNSRTDHKDNHHDNDKTGETNVEEQNLFINTAARLGCMFGINMTHSASKKSVEKSLKDYVAKTDNLKMLSPVTRLKSDMLTLTYDDVKLLVDKSSDATLFARNGYRKTMEDFLNKRITELINRD